MSGITLAPNFSRHSTHLLCPSGSGAKYEKALEWEVPVVTMEWLEDMSRRGVIGAEAGFLVGNGNGRSNERAADMCMDVDVGHEIGGVTDIEGKGKEKDTSSFGKVKERGVDMGAKMADITNSE